MGFAMKGGPMKGEDDEADEDAGRGTNTNGGMDEKTDSKTEARASA
jgi:hypothetical protein